MTRGAPSTPPSFKERVDKPAPGDFVYNQSLDHVKRQFGRQHIQMIALAGTIGTGLFLGLGQILGLAGPLGSLLLYIHVASVAYATILAVGEMTAYAPISGSLLLYVARWLDPAAGFALGWNYFFFVGTAIPLEITAFAAMIRFWDTNSDHTAIYITVIIVALLLINLFGVRWFGNSEIFFASLKIILVVGLIIGGLVISLGGGPDHQVIGFKAILAESGTLFFLLYSVVGPGPKGRFLGVLFAVTPAAFSLSGVELISIVAAETQQPRTNIIKAMKTVIFRLLFFYIASVIVVGMLVPSTDKALFTPGASAGQSPFVIAFQRAGVKVLPSIVNAILITSAFSAANTFVFSASRILYGLAVQKRAPKLFTTCTQNGLPWVAVLVSWLFSFLAFMNVTASAATVFNWFVSLGNDVWIDWVNIFGRLVLQIVDVSYHSWLTLNTTYLRYYYGLRQQGIVSRGVYRSPLQPYAAMWVIFWVPFYIVLNGVSVFLNWNTTKFVTAYINLPIFLFLFIGYKVWYKTRIAPLDELDFISNIPTLEETGDEGLLVEKRSFMQKLRELV